MFVIIYSLSEWLCYQIQAYIKLSTVLIKYRDGTIVSIITYTKIRLTYYAKKVCINITNSMYACFICLSLFFINRLHKKL